ncbi:MAG: hypothetical protein ACRD8O_05040 [Bryobacteraceae bacterium]
MRRLLFSMAFFAAAIFAVDVNGNWKATAEGPNGTFERTFMFKVEGSKLTGETTSTLMSKSTINDGKVDGDNLTFTITIRFQDNEMKVNFKGKIEGSEVRFTSEIAGSGQTLDWRGKRIS